MTDKPPDTLERVTNSMGHLLIECRVMFDWDPPRSRTTVSFYPIIAYISLSDGTYEPVIVTGRVPSWSSVRASLAGGAVYGVCSSPPAGVTTANHLYPSLKHFVSHERVSIAAAVDKVRRDKGYLPDDFALNLLDAEKEWVVHYTDAADE